MSGMKFAADFALSHALDDVLVRQTAQSGRLKAFNDRCMAAAGYACVGAVLLAWVIGVAAGWERAIYWGGAMLVIESLILWAGLRCRRSLAAGRSAERWLRAQIVLAGFAGVCWGSAVWAAWTGVPHAQYFLVLTIVVGVAGISIVTMAAYASASALYYGAINLLPMAHVLTHDIPSGGLIVAGLVTGLVVELSYCRDLRGVLLRDVEQHARNQALVEKLTELLTHDQLTGAYSRRHIFKQLDRMVASRARHGTQATLIMFDLDHFKRINDTYGHPTGDRALKRATRVVSAELRSEDMLGRIGGEEFLVALPMTDAASARPLAERLRQALAKSSIVDGSSTIHLPASFGVAELRPAESATEWFRRVDGALYRAKEQGRNRVEVAE